MSLIDSDPRKEHRDAIKRKGASKAKRIRLGKLLSECGEQLVITCRFPEAQFGFPIREVDPLHRALIDAACAERGLR